MLCFFSLFLVWNHPVVNLYVLAGNVFFCEAIAVHVAVSCCDALVAHRPAAYGNLVLTLEHVCIKWSLVKLFLIGGENYNEKLIVNPSSYATTLSFFSKIFIFYGVWDVSMGGHISICLVTRLTDWIGLLL